MSDLVDWNRPEKGVARNFAMEYEGKIYNTFLCLPAHSCLDLRQGLKNGSVRKTDRIIAVDNNPDNWMRTERFLQRNFGANYIFFKGNVEDFPMARMMKERNFPKIDFSFFDLCGQLCPTRVKWLFDNRVCFAPNCRFGLTVSAAQRWMKQWEKIICNIATEMFYSDDLETLLTNAKNNLAKDIFGLPIDIKKRQKLKKNKITEFTNVIKSIKASCSIFMMAMNNFNMTINRVYRYKESNDDEKHTEMVFIDFRFDGNDIGDDICLDVIEEFKSSGYYSNRKKRPVDKPKIVLKNANAIARHMGIYGNFESIFDMKPCSRAHIKINAKKFGLNPKNVTTKIEKRLKKYGLKA